MEKAMRLFWRHGYDGVSLTNLTVAMGVTPPSLYAAFTSKADLYRAALDRYGTLDLTAMREASTLVDAVRTLLRAAVEAVTDPGRERGCMLSSGLIEVHPDHRALADETAKRRNALRSDLAEVLRRWLDGDRAAGVAGVLSAFLTGLSVQARDGVSAEELHTAAAEYCATLAAMTCRGEATFEKDDKHGA